MPLPAEHAAWPPPELAKALDRFATYDAWWSADADALREYYQRETGIGFANRPAQSDGGPAITAREVAARERRSMLARARELRGLLAMFDVGSDPRYDVFSDIADAFRMLVHVCSGRSGST
jgi:hypothetical protein